MISSNAGRIASAVTADGSISARNDVIQPNNTTMPPSQTFGIDECESTSNAISNKNTNEEENEASRNFNEIDHEEGNNQEDSCSK